MHLDYYFPTPIWWEQVNINNDEIVNFCHTLRNSDPIGRKLSNIGGWQSQNLKPHEHQSLHLLSNTIYQLSSKCIEDIGYDVNGASLEILNMWVNINEEFNYNQVHIHDTSLLSGVYYAKCSDNSGELEFYRNFSDQFIISSVGPVERSTTISASVARYRPAVGMLVLFPSHIPHSVLPSTVAEERISLAFNLRLFKRG